MKNSFIEKFLVLLVIITGFLFAHLFLASKIKILNKQFEELNAELAKEQDVMDAEIVALQKLSSEERIVKIAREKLGLVRSTTMFKKIFVSESKIQRLKKIVDAKYE